MVDLIKTGSDWLADQLKTNAGQSVTYIRGANNVALTATIGQSVVEAVDEDGRVIRIETRDFLIHRADLILGGVEVEPDRGDQITWVDGSTTYRYEVMPLAGEDHWRDSDPYRKVLRIHTKRVAVE